MQQSLKEFDYIIVGAGSAGCVLANRLTADGKHSVLLLEAGGNADTFLTRIPVGFLKAMRKPEFNWGFTTEPEPELGGRKLMIPRGKGLGGSTLINGMFYMRGHPRDYDLWRQMGCDGWSYDDVLPYFKRAERNARGGDQWRGDQGPLDVVPISTSKLLHESLMQTAEANGYHTSTDINGADPEGFALGEITADRQGRRGTTARAYLMPALARPNLAVETGALTTRLLIERGRAVGVEYRKDGELHQVRAAGEVILSGGTYASPQLLLLSGIGPADELSGLGITPLLDLPGVGRNLSEHPYVPLEFAATRKVTFLNELRLDRAITSVLRWKLFGTGPFATQINSCNIVIRTSPELEQPDIQIMCNPVRMDADIWFPGWRKEPAHVFSVGICLLHPYSRGSMTLRSADPTAAPVIRMNLFSDPTDLATMRRGIRAARQIYRTEPQAQLTGAERLPGEAVQSDADLDKFLRAMAAVTQHPVGTCTMGIGAEAVVDPQLRVHGIEGLRVIDASIMPTVPGANTNASAIMIGEKGADLVLGR